MQNNQQIRLVSPKIAIHSEIWHLMELRVENGFGPIGMIQWLCGREEIDMLASGSYSKGAGEIAYLIGVEEWSN